jgi:spore germination protein YaaH
LINFISILENKRSSLSHFDCIDQEFKISQTRLMCKYEMNMNVSSRSEILYRIIRNSFRQNRMMNEIIHVIKNYRKLFSAIQKQKNELLDFFVQQERSHLSSSVEFSSITVLVLAASIVSQIQWFEHQIASQSST